MTTRDLSALQREPTRAELQDLRRRARAGEFGPSAGPGIVGFVIAAVALVFFGVVLTTMLPAFVRSFRISGGTAFPMFGAFGVFFLLVAGFIVVMLVIAVIAQVTTRHDWAKIALFARANGLQFQRCSADPVYPAGIFAQGHERALLNHVWSPTGLFADAGTFTYTTGSGEDAETHTVGYAAFRLPRPLPHVRLDHASPVSRVLSSDLAGDQRIALGEPFDSRFIAYAPAGYGPDAFRLLPPDLQQHLLEMPLPCSVEIVDSWVFVYTPQLDLASPESWQGLDQIETTAVARLARLAGSYSDDRSAAALAFPALGPGRPHRPIAEAGRRLRTSPTRAQVVVGLMAVVGIMIVLWLAFRAISDNLQAFIP